MSILLECISAQILLISEGKNSCANFRMQLGNHCRCWDVVWQIKILRQIQNFRNAKSLKHICSFNYEHTKG